MKTRILQAYDTTANWDNCSNVPKAGEIVVYSDAHGENYPDIKIGDGTTTLSNLNYVGKKVVKQLVCATVMAPSNELTKIKVETGDTYVVKVKIDENQYEELPESDKLSVMLKDPYVAYACESDSHNTFDVGLPNVCVDINRKTTTLHINVVTDSTMYEYLPLEIPVERTGTAFSASATKDEVLNNMKKITGDSNYTTPDKYTGVSVSQLESITKAHANSIQSNTNKIDTNISAIDAIKRQFGYQEGNPEVDRVTDLENAVSYQLDPLYSNTNQLLNVCLITNLTDFEKYCTYNDSKKQWELGNNTTFLLLTNELSASPEYKYVFSSKSCKIFGCGTTLEGFSFGGNYQTFHDVTLNNCTFSGRIDLINSMFVNTVSNSTNIGGNGQEIVSNNSMIDLSNCQLYSLPKVTLLNDSKMWLDLYPTMRGWRSLEFPNGSSINRSSINITFRSSDSFHLYNLTANNSSIKIYLNRANQDVSAENIYINSNVGTDSPIIIDSDIDVYKYDDADAFAVWLGGCACCRLNTYGLSGQNTALYYTNSTWSSFVTHHVFTTQT